MALEAVVDVSSISKAPVPPPSPPRIDSWARGGRRSKRRAGSPAASDGADHDQSEQEYLALCLLMLSRGLRGDAGADARSAAAAPTAANKAGLGQHHHQNGYECSVCGKVYASYQALGGHKTSHRKPPTPPTPPAGAAAAAPGDEASSGSGGAAHAEEKEKVHQCSLCLRTFPSGQALGGHKRLHYEGGDGAAKDKDNKDAATKTNNKASATTAATTAVMRDFDLNLPAEGAPPEAKRARTMLLVV